MFRYQSLSLFDGLFSFLNVLIHVFLQIWNAFGFTSWHLFPSFSLLLRSLLIIFSAILDNVTGSLRKYILLLYFISVPQHYLTSLSFEFIDSSATQYTVVSLLVNFSCVSYWIIQLQSWIKNNSKTIFWYFYIKAIIMTSF